MCVYVSYLCTGTQPYTCMPMHTKAHSIIIRTYRLTVICAYIRVNACSSFIHTYVLRHSQTCAYTHTYTQTNTHTHIHTHIHTHTHTRTRTHTHIHSYTHTHTYTHTRACAHTYTYRYHTLVQIISIIAKEKCDYDNRASSYLFWTKLSF